MKRLDQISSLFWFVAGIGITLLSLKYEFGTFLTPGAGFITFFAGLLLSILSLLLFLSSWKSRDSAIRLRTLWEGLEWGKVLYVIALLILYTLVLKPAGFVLSTFLLLTFLFKIKSSFHWMKVILLSLLITFGAFLLFHVWLQVQLPKGILQGII